MLHEQFPILTKNYYIKMSDGSVWAIPIVEIAMDHAETHAANYEDLVDSLHTGTLPLFQENEKQVEYWAKTLDWHMVKPSATQITPPDSSKKYSDEWKNTDQIKIR